MGGEWSTHKLGCIMFGCIKIVRVGAEIRLLVGIRKSRCDQVFKRGHPPRLSPQASYAGDSQLPGGATAGYGHSAEIKGDYPVDKPTTFSALR
jgi:hypothetical protein